MVGTTELESVTSCMSSKRSNQLSYAPADNDTIIAETKSKVKHSCPKNKFFYEFFSAFFNSGKRVHSNSNRYRAHASAP